LLTMLQTFLHRLRATTFRRQLSILVTVGVLALALLSSLAMSWQSSRDIQANRQQHGQRLAESLARQSRLALLSDSPDNVTDAVLGGLAFPDVARVEVRYLDGRSLVAYGANGVALMLPTEVAPAHMAQQVAPVPELEDAQAWRFVVPVRTAAKLSPFEDDAQAAQTLGYVRVVLSKASMQQAVLDLFVLNGGIALAFALLFLAVTRWVSMRMTQPLAQLADTMGRAEQGESGVRAQISGARDIVHMAQAFNGMMQVLDERDQSLRQAREEALHLARLKAEFAATMSHELRTPLNGVVGTLDILRASSLNPVARSYVNLAWDSSQYLLDLINNILDFSALDSNKLRLNEVDCDLVRLCEQVIDLVTPQVGSKGLEIGYVLAPDVPQRVCVDARRLRQVLLNLLGNAVKFTERGEVAIRVSAVGAFGDSGALRFEVSDTGVGVPESARGLIFESYTQADPSSTRSHDGSGLGLAICKKLCLLMGGSIGVDSVAGVGSTFWFTLPLRRSTESLPLTRGGTERSGRVLVLDDSTVVRQFAQQSLQACGYDCAAVGQVPAAATALLEAAQAGAPYQLLVVDLSLAQTHGPLVQDLRSAPQYGHPRLVLMNRHGALLEPGLIKADAYLAKPLRVERLQACVDGVLGHAGQALRAGALAVGVPVNAPRILVVEDNRTSQTIAQGMLHMLGYKTDVAANGRLAVLAFKREAWDLILMDCNMPEMDGYEATTAIRALENPTERRLPIVAMTANTQAADVAKCLSAGMDDHLSKPLTLENLRTRLQRWLPAVPLATLAPAAEQMSLHRQDETVDVAALIRLREALGGTIGQAIRPFLEDMPRYLEDLDAAAVVGRTPDLRYTAHAIKGAAGNLGASGLAELARELEALSEAGQGDAAAQLLPRLRAEYTLVMQELQHEMDAEGEIDLPQAAMDAARVLIVDDDRSTRFTLSAALQRSGFVVTQASDGSEVAQAVQRARPDVILMDALMPVMDGFTACSLLKSSPEGQDIPVLMITALEDNASIERAFAAGASDYIPKPLHLAVVNQRVRRLVDATRAERHVRHLAYNDPLTGLPNRTLFNDHLNGCIERAGPAEQSLALLYLDLDRFKFVNDTLGHEVGDRLLRALAQRIRSCVRGSDCVARLGGDEFAVVLDDLPGIEVASATANKICHAVNAPVEIDGHDLTVTASIGIALFPSDGQDASALLRRADTAMYRAKKKHSDFEFFEESMEASAGENLRLVGALRHALERKEFAVYFQPITQAAGKGVVGMEALVRWNHPTRGLVSPVEFIPLAEETGLIVPMGEWVLRTACEQLVAWHKAGHSGLYVTVNLSGLQLQLPTIADTVRSILVDTGLNPACLTLEITESMLMEHVDATLATLVALKSTGVNLAIDDFGTGYSSLSYLRRFPVDVLKIDRAFVREMTVNADDASIVQGIIALAHSLRLKVVAEGVETIAQYDALEKLGCDLMQGYLWSPPVPAPQFYGRFLAVTVAS
jgi:diguanylate cyclase (GGDEF)-like protein